MAGFGSVLKGIGHFLGKAFSPNAVKLEAGIVEAALPGFAPLIGSAASAVIGAENAAIAAGMQNGTGTQKMAFALSSFQSTYNAWAAQNGLKQTPEQAQAVLQSVVNVLNVLEPVSAPALSAQTAPIQAAPVVNATPTTAIQG